MKIDSCGSYAPYLKKIAMEIYENKKGNGQVINSLDMDYIDEELFKGYRKILLYAQGDNNKTAVALETLTQLVNSGSSIDDISKSVDTAIRSMEIERISLDDEDNRLKNAGASAVVSLVDSVINNSNGMENILDIDKLYSKNIQHSINTTFAKAATGNVSATKSSIIIQQLTKATRDYLAPNNKTNKRAVFGWMMNGSSLNDKEVDEVIIANAELIGLDITEQTPEGKILSRDKLSAAYASEIGKVNPQMASRTIQSFEPIMNAKVGMALARGMFKKPNLTIETFAQDMEKNARKQTVRSELYEAIKNGDMEKARGIASQSPKETKEILSDLIELQHKEGISSKALANIQAKCVGIGEIVKGIELDRNNVEKDDSKKKDISMAENNIQKEDSYKREIDGDER